MTAVDLVMLAQELAAAGVAVPNGLGTPDNTLETVHTWDADGFEAALPAEAGPVLAKHDASKPQRAAAFETAEDRERLALVAERSASDPAFAALADLTLPRGG